MIIIIWLAQRAGKMNQIARSDGLPDRARGLPAVTCKKNFTKSNIINPLLTKFVRSRWLDIALVLFFFCEFMDRDEVEVHKLAKKKDFGQYPAILTSHLVNNPPYILKNRSDG